MTLTYLAGVNDQIIFSSTSNGAKLIVGVKYFATTGTALIVEIKHRINQTAGFVDGRTQSELLKK